MVPKEKTKTDSAQRALQLLNEKLKDGNHPEGMRLAPERRLADELGVSRRALRVALGRLEAEGKIWRGVGQGTFVGHRPLDSRIDIPTIRQQTSPAELMEARLVLEPAIAALATVHATNKDLEEAWRCLAKSSNVSDAQSWELWDGSLHSAIAHSVHNTLISALFDILNSVRTHADWGRLRRASMTPDRQQLYTAQHRAILTAISDRDAESASQAMQTHLLTVKGTLLDNRAGSIPTTGNIP